MKVEWSPGDGLIQLTTESVKEATTLLALAYHKYAVAGAVNGCEICHGYGSTTVEGDIFELLDNIYNGLIALLTKEGSTNGPRTDA